MKPAIDVPRGAKTIDKRPEQIMGILRYTKYIELFDLLHVAFTLEGHCMSIYLVGMWAPLTMNQTKSKIWESGISIHMI